MALSHYMQISVQVLILYPLSNTHVTLLILSNVISIITNIIQCDKNRLSLLLDNMQFYIHYKALLVLIPLDNAQE